MKAPTNSRKDASLELNLTSMIDVIFLLLVFFAFTSNFKEPEKLLPTKLSSAGAITTETKPTQEERDLGKIVASLRVDKDGRVLYSIDGKPFDSLQEIETTLTSLQEIEPNAPVVVDPERNVPLESVLDVYDVARRVGLTKIKFTASPEALAGRR